MLPEIAAEVLRFLTRRDLAKASCVSKWLDAMIAQCCELYPLRPVRQIALYQDYYLYGFSARVTLKHGRIMTRSNSMDAAAHFVGSILDHSFVEELLEVFFKELNTHFWLFHTVDNLSLSPGHWTTLIEAMRVGSVRSLNVRCVDFSALRAYAFLSAVRCRGLQSFRVRKSVVPSDFVTDELLRVSAAQGLLELSCFRNKSDAPHRVSDPGVLDFVFRANGPPGRVDLKLMLDESAVSDMFVSKFFERLGSSPSRPCGTLKFYGIAKQRNLPEYAPYLARTVL